MNQHRNRGHNRPHPEQMRQDRERGAYGHGTQSVHGTRAAQHPVPDRYLHDDPREKFIHNNMRTGLPPAHPGYDHGMRMGLPPHPREEWENDVRHPRQRRHPDNYSMNPQGNLRRIGQDPREDHFDDLELEDYGSRAAWGEGFGGYGYHGPRGRDEYEMMYPQQGASRPDYGFDQGSPGYDAYSQNTFGGARNEGYRYGNNLGYGGPRLAGSDNPGHYARDRRDMRGETNDGGRVY